MFAFPSNPNALWDIGGGTSIARIYLPSGTMVQDAEIILPGTKELAQQVASEVQAIRIELSQRWQTSWMRCSWRLSLWHSKLDFSAIYQDSVRSGLNPPVLKSAPSVKVST
jgi:hypothetical protein